MKKTASITALIVAFSAAAGLAVLSTACGDDDTTNGGGATSSSSGGTSSSSGSTSSSSGATSSSSGTVPGGAAALAKATCARMKACTPNAFAAQYADDAACESGTGGGTEVEYPGLTDLDDAAATACAAKVSANTDCALNSSVLASADCTKAGTLADGTACNFGGQCAGGVCNEYNAQFCGKCKVAKKLDEACAPANAECGAGLYCATDKCKAVIATGADCTATDVCADGGSCKEGKCKLPGKIGDACTAATTLQDCYTGLSCVDNKCAEATYADVGGDCDAAAFKLCKASACDTAAKKCVAYVALEADCNATDKQCDPSKATCDAGTNKCKALPAANVCK